MVQQPKGIIEASYFVARRLMIVEMRKYKNSFPYLLGMVLRITQNVANVKTYQRERLHGKLGYILRNLFALWINSFTAFSVLLLCMSSLIGSICSILGFIAVIVTVICKLIDVNVDVVWSSIIALILFIDEYLRRAYISINRSLQYVIRDFINVEN